MLSDPPAKSSLVCINMLVENDSNRKCTLLWVIVPPVILLTDTITIGKKRCYCHQWLNVEGTL